MLALIEYIALAEIVEKSRERQRLMIRMSLNEIIEDNLLIWDIENEYNSLSRK